MDYLWAVTCILYMWHMQFIRSICTICTISMDVPSRLASPEGLIVYIIIRYVPHLHILLAAWRAHDLLLTLLIPSHPNHPIPTSVQLAISYLVLSFNSLLIHPAKGKRSEAQPLTTYQSSSARPRLFIYFSWTPNIQYPNI